MATTFVRTRATWLSYLMLTLYGFLLNIFGPITPFLKNEMNLSYTVSSFHFSAFALGMIGAGLSGHLLIERVGRWNALWIGAFGMAAGALLLAAGRAPVVTIGASFLMGLIGSLILSIYSTILADQHGELRAVAYSEGNVLASVLSAIAPLLVGWLAGTAPGWRAALVLAAIAVVVLRFSFGKVTLPASSNADQGEGSNRLPRLYWVLWVALVLSVSVEFCMVFWSADYLETELGLAKADAAQAVSLFLAGMIVGRAASSRLVQRFNTYPIITASLLIAAAGFLLYWIAPGPLLGLAGLFLTGLGVSTLYPLILALTIGASGNNMERGGALASLASGVAIFTLPLILGRLADAVGIRPAYGVVIILVALALVIVRATAGQAQPAAAQVMS